MRIQRRGFTLVEMMVAMVLTIFIMVILAQCFVQGLETFSGLKAVGDMQEELRTAVTLLRADLSQDHFEGKRRLSEPADSLMANKIKEGFFVIGQGYPVPNPVPIVPTTSPSPGKIQEGPDPDLIGSYHVTDHWLHFSVKLRGNAREKFYSAADASRLLGTVACSQLDQQTNPDASNYTVFQNATSTNTLDPQVYFSSWAEVAYFLVQTGTTVSPGNPKDTISGGTKLYALYRCQFLVFPNTNINIPRIQPSPPWTLYAANNAPNNTAGTLKIKNYRGFSCTPYPAPSNRIDFHSPSDLAAGWTTPGQIKLQRAFNPYDPNWPARPTSSYAGTAPDNDPTKIWPQAYGGAATLVLSNVISFQVQVLKMPYPIPRPNPSNNPPIIPLFPNPSPGGPPFIPPPPTDFTDLAMVDPTSPTLAAYNYPFDTANYSTANYTNRMPNNYSIAPNIIFGAFSTPSQVPCETHRVFPPQVPLAKDMAFPFSIQGLQIILRIWDPKSLQARQVTMVQDM